MKFSKRATETAWLVSNLVLTVCGSALAGFVFVIGREPGGVLILLGSILWAAFVFHNARCLYRVGREDGQKEGYDGGHEDGFAAGHKVGFGAGQESGVKAEQARLQAEEERKLAEWNEAQSALWAAVGDTIRERVQEYAITVHNPNYEDEN